MKRTEGEIKAEIQVELCKDPGTRIFNQPVGLFWQGDMRSRHLGTVILDNARPVKTGLAPGSSDLIGWRSIVITPDMVGKRIAQFVAVETKSARGTASEEQKSFIAAVLKAGGAAGIAKSLDDAKKILRAPWLIGEGG